jgi:putative transposase
MCKVLSVSKSGFYDSLRATPSPRTQRSFAIRAAVRLAHEESHGIYGSQKIAEVMKQDNRMETGCRNTVARAMKEMGLKSSVSKKFKLTTPVADPSLRPEENILDQNSEATAPNQKWVTDITYLSTLGGWIYLSVAIDLFRRKVIGWSTSERLTTPLVSDALKKAIETRRPDVGQLLHQSDQGCHYRSDTYQLLLKSL